MWDFPTQFSCGFWSHFFRRLLAHRTMLWFSRETTKWWWNQRSSLDKRIQQPKCFFSKPNLIFHSNVVLFGQSLMQDTSLYFSLLSIRDKELFSISTPTFVINLCCRMDGWIWVWLGTMLLMCNCQSFATYAHNI